MLVVLTLLSVLVTSSCSSVDLTLVERATGAAVVNAVVDIISQSCVFDNDRLMLRRIAYAETRDGAASYTFTQGGGIWQVCQGILKRILLVGQRWSKLAVGSGEGRRNPSLVWGLGLCLQIHIF